MRSSFSLSFPEAHHDAYERYREFRCHAPVHLFPEQGFWGVSRYGDAVSVLKRPDLFSSRVMAPLDSCLLGCDPPEHTRFRRIVADVFSAHRRAALEGQVRVIVRRLLEPMKKNGRMELIADLANPLPILVVIELLGADPERAEDLKRWSRGIVAKATRRLSPDEKEATSVGFRQLTAYLEQHIERCRSRRHPGILGDLLASAKEERLTPKEALSFARLLLVAGTETTTHLIGNTVLALLGNPAEMEKVRTTPELVSDLVEEALRHTSPVQFVYRAARRTMELSGARIPAGALVAVLLGSANRDPEQFPEPDRFLVSRSPRHHLGFGIGPHSCLGAQIARLESRIVLEELLSLPGKVRALQPPDSVELIESVQMRGPKRLTLMSADVTF